MRAARFPIFASRKPTRRLTARFSEKLADWCDRYTPLVALDPPHGLFLDISGCAHLFARVADDGEEERSSPTAFAASPAQGFEVRGAIASTAGAAWALAHYGEGGCIPAGGEAEALADLPVAALRIGPEQNALLDRLGLKRIGQLIGKPRAPLAARFGIDLVTRLDQALGHLDEVLSPRRPAPSLSAERRFAEPVVDQDSLLQTVASLAKNARSGARAERPRRAPARSGVLPHRRRGCSGRGRHGRAASRAGGQSHALFRTAFGARFGMGCRLRLRHGPPRRAPLRTAFRDADRSRRGGGDDRRPDALYDRLGARLGPARITRYLPVDTHIPERAVARAAGGVAIGCRSRHLSAAAGCRKRRPSGRSASSPIRSRWR